MLKIFAFAALAAVGVLLAYAAMRPATFTVARSTTVHAPAERIHGLINDMRAFNSWNPFTRKDPALRGEYRGPAAGPGSHYAFQGNKDVGAGSVEIVGSEPRLVTMKLDMVEPFEGHNLIHFSLAPKGAATEVTWAMSGPSPYIARLIGIFFNMDRMVGGDFEKGLADLKARAERG